MRVLVVDDDPIVMDVVMRSLSEQHYAVDIAGVRLYAIVTYPNQGLNLRSLYQSATLSLEGQTNE